MRKKELCLKVLAVVITIGAVTCAFGRELLVLAFEENHKKEIRILVTNKTAENSAIAKLEEKVCSRAKISENIRKTDSVPFLCKSIKYNCQETNKYILYTNSNQFLCYSKLTGIWVYYRYDCPVGNAKYSADMCIDKVRQATKAAILSNGKDEKIGISLYGEDERYLTYTAELNGCVGVKIYIGIRKDTGNIVLFDARELENYLFSKKNEK